MIDISETLFLKDETQAQILHLTNKFKNEPIYHGLFREAWGQRTTNPRSSIVTGMSAAEVGIKQCIGVLVPDAQWLADNVPSPRLKKLLTAYLPTLPAVNKINGNVVAPSKNVMEALEKGVTLRNEIVHLGKQSPQLESVESILLAIRDLLWLIDYYCGHEWALNYIREETLAEMKVET